LFEAKIADDPVISAAEKFDAKNEHGLLERVAMMQIRKVRKKEQIPAALAKIDAVAKLGFQDKVIAFQLNGTAANMCGSRGLDDAKRASAYAVKALAIGSDKEGFVKFLQGLVIEDSADEDPEEIEEEVEEEAIEKEEEVEKKETP